MTLATSTMTGDSRATEGMHILKGAINVTGRWQDMTKHDINHRKNEVLPTLLIASGCAVYLLLGWVKVFRSGLKEHSDLLTLRDVDWQLNEGLGADKSEQES